ncbi:MAG: tyrosine-protein phosphatase [Ilyomonas sp.]
MFSFFKSSKVDADLSFIGIDMHSHLLPGLDDGLKELDQTIAFVKELNTLGYHSLVCTPHILSDLYPNTPDTILPRLTIVREALKENNIPVQIHAAAEYMVDTDMESYVKSGKPLLTFGKNYILIEMSYLAASPNIEQVIFELRMKGLQPILAHPERYNFYHHDFSKYERMKDLGCLLQMNLLSISGYYGKGIKLVAEKLAKNKMIDLVGTDMHHTNHLNALKELATKKEFYKLMENIDLKNSSLLD